MQQTELKRKTPPRAKAKPKPRKPRRKQKKGSASAWKKKCDKLWSKIIRLRGRCLICPATKHLQAHHLIRRNCVAYRHDLQNGVCLCPQCHRYNNTCSAHGAPWGFEKWMEDNQPEQYRWWVKHRNRIITGQKMCYEAIHYDLQAIYDKEKNYDWTARTLGVPPWQENEHGD